MTTRLLMAVLAAVALAACGVHNEADHDQGRRGQSAAEAEPWAVTAWGQHFELFPEVDALVTGETAGAHVHVTVLDGFKPATQGSVTIVLVGSGGDRERFTATTVVRPGIFNVDVRPGAPGERDLLFEVEVGGVAETIPGGRVRVGTAEAPGGPVEAPHRHVEAGGGEAVDFLKEQQGRATVATA